MFRLGLKKYIPPLGWYVFNKGIREKALPLLASLDKFDNPIFVSGCQRSGTTAVRRAICQSPEIQEFWSEKDDELEGAKILSGIKDLDYEGRYCFQTTYLNESYVEYFQHDHQFKLIWMLRKPEAVIRSMLYNWRQYPLKVLFKSCGIAELEGKDKDLYQKKGVGALSLLKQACYAYCGKLTQLSIISSRLGESELCVSDYDFLVQEDSELRRVFEFSGLVYHSAYHKMFAVRNYGQTNGLTYEEENVIGQICSERYEAARNKYIK